MFNLKLFKRNYYMLKPVRIGEELNIENLKNFLAQNQLIDNTNTTIEIAQFSNGYSNLTYLLKTNNQEFVLRRPPKGAVKRGHDMSREFKVLSKLHQGFKESPKALAYCEDNDVIGSSFYVMEKIDGIILTNKEVQKRNIPATDFGLISNNWLSLFVKLHNTDYEAIGLSDLGRPNGYVERQVTNWGKQYHKAATMDIPEADKLIQWMTENQPQQYDHTLIHNDYKYDNVVFKDDTWSEIKAVLDWEMCTLGDPLMDLGTSVAYWMRPEDGPATKVLPSPTLAAGNPSRSELVNLYAEKSGRDVNNIVFYYAFGLFKIAVIVQQIFYRYNKGLTKDEKFAKLDRACAMFIQMGWQAVQKNRIEGFM